VIAGLRDCGIAGLLGCGDKIEELRDCGIVNMERMTKEEFKKWLKARTRTFAVSVFRLVDELPKAASTQVIAFQLAKSASSMGAHYREATRAESGADFTHKIGIVEKESDETLFWLEVLSELYPAPHAIRNRLDPLFQEADELLRLFTSIKKNCKPARQSTSLNSRN
jgi:four helix bundle protein